SPLVNREHRHRQTEQTGSVTVEPLQGADVTAREAEVLTLLREHLTNPEIAERLYISQRTVESHVSSLLRKFGAADRRALARHRPPSVPEVDGAAELPPSIE